MLYGFVKNPVIDMRAEPKFRSERVHQLVFGEILAINAENIYRVERNDYIYATDVRLNYSGFVNKNTIIILTEEEKKELERFSILKVTNNFCRVILEDSAIKYTLPFGSRFYTDKKDILKCYLPNGKFLTVIDNPNFEILEDIRTGKREKMLKLALNFVGIPYLWGGTSSYGFDCSGFVNRIYDVFDITIPRDANQQEQVLEEVSKVQPGDLLFMEGHVMLYFDNGKVVHANGYDMCVSITDLEKEDYGRWLKNKVRKICTVSEI
ncbi:MAG: C40 family peptidase [Fervidobacterium sp.]